MERIALVIHDHANLTTLRRLFEDKGFKVDAYREAELALQGLVRRKPDVAIVDIELPKVDGFELMERLREKSDLPVVLLNPDGAEATEVIGLRMGAQDVVAKPVSERVLVERMRLALSRARQAETTKPNGARLVCPPLVIDCEEHRVSWDGVEVDLTPSEFEILQLLAERPGHVKTRQAIQDRVYGDRVYVTDRTIDSHIKRVRRKLKDADPAFDAIKTVYGLGYRLEVRKNTSLRRAS